MLWPVGLPHPAATATLLACLQIVPQQQRLLPYRLCAARYLPGPGSRYVGRGYDIAILELDPKTVSGRNELVALPTYVREWPGAHALGCFRLAT